MNKSLFSLLVIACLIAVTLATRMGGSRPFTKMAKTMAVFDEDEAQWDMSGNLSNSGWSGSLGNGGFSGSVGGQWGSSNPTIGAGYTGNVWGGQLSAGVQKTIGVSGSLGASIGWTARFEEDMDAALDALEELQSLCQCIRAPCNCGF